MVQAIGTHLIVELRNCSNVAFLNDAKGIEDVMVSAAKEAGATVMGAHFHEFKPQGVSGVVIISESHLSIHTWPENGYAAVDVFTCGDVVQPNVAANYLIKAFGSKNPSVMEIQRGADVPIPEEMPTYVSVFDSLPYDPKSVTCSIQYEH